MREFRSCSGAGGAPTWPAGVQGSSDSLRRLRHSRGRSLYRISAIGIDAEPDAPLPRWRPGPYSDTCERDRLASSGIEVVLGASAVQ